MIDTKTVLYLFQRAAKLRQEEERARGEYGGYSWGYHGYWFIKAADDAEEEAAKALDALIDARIAKALGKEGQ